MLTRTNVSNSNSECQANASACSTFCQFATPLGPSRLRQCRALHTVDLSNLVSPRRAKFERSPLESSMPFDTGYSVGQFAGRSTNSRLGFQDHAQLATWLLEAATNVACWPGQVISTVRLSKLLSLRDYQLIQTRTSQNISRGLLRYVLGPHTHSAVSLRRIVDLSRSSRSEPIPLRPVSEGDS